MSKEEYQKKVNKNEQCKPRERERERETWKERKTKREQEMTQRATETNIKRVIKNRG